MLSPCLILENLPFVNAGSLERTLQIKYGEPNADALVESALNHIDNRVLLFAGDMDPYFDWIKEASKKLKNSHFLNLKGVGHVGSFYRINRSINFIINFLEEKRGDNGK